MKENLQQPDERDSHMRVNLIVGVEYQRRRSDTPDLWEARIGTIGLLIAGVLAAALLLIVILPRLLGLIFQ